MRGVISLRGRIVPVLCLATRLGGAAGSGDDSRIVIAEHGDERAGLIVDDRPYAGWLDASALLTGETKDTLDTWKLDLGVVGAILPQPLVHRALLGELGHDEAPGALLARVVESQPPAAAAEPALAV